MSLPTTGSLYRRVALHRRSILNLSSNASLAASCDGTPRVVDATNPNPAFPTFGGANGGFEVYISEGYSHVDIVTAEDDATNNVVAPLAAFLERNAQ